MGSVLRACFGRGARRKRLVLKALSAIVLKVQDRSKMHLLERTLFI